MKRLIVASVLALALAACATTPTQHADLNSVGTARPLSAIAVSQCGLAVALYVQLDATHLLRADPRQSDLFVATDGQMQSQHAPPMKWEDAFALAQKAAITSHVLLPCTDGPTI